MVLWRNVVMHAIAVVWMNVCCCAIGSGSTLDRDYLFGEDGFELGSAGDLAGTIFKGARLTFDSFGSPDTGDLQDLLVEGNPRYASVSDRPFFSGGVGIAFDGNGDYLRGSNLNLPATSAASFSNDDDPSDIQIPGPNNYEGISDRYFQFWVKPDSASQARTQSLVMDTNQHGVRIVDGKWSMRYAGGDFDSTADVDFDAWNHVMLARPFGAANGSRMFVNGVLVSAAPGGYDGTATEELVVGSDTSRDASLNFTGGSGEFFHGVMDNLSMSIIGDNSSFGGQDYGGFDVFVDNEFIARTLEGIDIADVNANGTISGNGTGLADADDVTAFVEGWRAKKSINGVQVGDLVTRRNGDLNLDGITDLSDWIILNEANPAAGALTAAAISVPEPASLLGCLFAVIALWVVRERIASPSPDSYGFGKP